MNFQLLSDTTVPANYRADIGAPYGLKRNGFTYGWSSDTTTAINRNDARSPDERYDAFNYLAADQTWQIKLPGPGTYWVRVVAGDPKVFNSAIRITAEDVIVAEGAMTSKQRRIDGRTTVAVNDGVLTLAAALARSTTSCVSCRSCASIRPRRHPPRREGRMLRPVSTVTNVVTWADRSADETGFRVERARGASGPFMLVGVVGKNATQFVDTQLRPGTTYRYRIRAFNAAGGSAASGVDLAHVQRIRRRDRLGANPPAPVPAERR